MLLVRTAVIVVGMALAYVAFTVTGHRDALLLALTTATLMTVVANLVSLAALTRLTRAEGRRLGDLVGFSWRRLPTDICWGLLWLLVLNTPFIVVITSLTFAIYRPTSETEIAAAFERVFAGPFAEVTSLSVDFPVWYTIVVTTAFALLNPVVEEMHYRGWLQPALTALTGRTWGIALTAAGFGLQHLSYGWTATGALIYIAAFFVWGATAGVIYHRQRRLVPLIVSHFLVNAGFVVPIALAQ